MLDFESGVDDEAYTDVVENKLDRVFTKQPGLTNFHMRNLSSGMVERVTQPYS